MKSSFSSSRDQCTGSTGTFTRLAVAGWPGGARGSPGWLPTWDMGPRTDDLWGPSCAQGSALRPTSDLGTSRKSEQAHVEQQCASGGRERFCWALLGGLLEGLRRALGGSQTLRQPGLRPGGPPMRVGWLASRAPGAAARRPPPPPLTWPCTRPAGAVATTTIFSPGSPA